MLLHFYSRPFQFTACICIASARSMRARASISTTCAAHAPSTVDLVEPVEPGIGIGLHTSGIACKVSFGTLAAAMSRRHRCRQACTSIWPALQVVLVAEAVARIDRCLPSSARSMSKNSDTGKAIDYSLKRWDALTCFLNDGRPCLSNIAAERELRAVAIGRATGPSPAPTKATSVPPRSAP